MKWEKAKHNGFTIVELLIVVVVIAILAAITIVSYNGIQNRARQSAAASTLRQAVIKISLYSAGHAERLPSSLADAEITQQGSDVLTYFAISPTLYCVSVASSGRNYYVRSDATSTVLDGSCNSIDWVAGSPLAYSDQPGGSATLSSSVGPGQNMTFYSLFSIANANFGYSALGGVYPASGGVSRFYLQGATSGSTSSGYRIDTTATANVSGSQGNVRTPGYHIGWLQSSGDATSRSFAYDQTAPSQTGSLDGGQGWSFVRLEVAASTSSYAGTAAVVYNTAHDEATRRLIMNWLAQRYSTGLSF